MAIRSCGDAGRATEVLLLGNLCGVDADAHTTELLGGERGQSCIRGNLCTHCQRPAHTHGVALTDYASRGIDPDWRHHDGAQRYRCTVLHHHHRTTLTVARHLRRHVVAGIAWQIDAHGLARGFLADGALRGSRCLV